MEEPSREWDQALAGIEPVRFEFPYADPRRLRRGVIVWSLYYALLCGGLIVWGVAERLLLLVVFGVFFFICSEVVALNWQHRWMERPPEEVILQGVQLSIVRYGRSSSSEERYNILEIHDLRDSLGEGVRYARSWPSEVHPVYETSEPIRFSYHHGGYSFGGIPMTHQAASAVVEQIAEYAASVREHLGMHVESDITAYDRERVADAMERSWDVDVPHGAL